MGIQAHLQSFRDILKNLQNSRPQAQALNAQTLEDCPESPKRFHVLPSLPSGEASWLRGGPGTRAVPDELTLPTSPAGEAGLLRNGEQRLPKTQCLLSICCVSREVYSTEGQVRRSRHVVAQVRCCTLTHGSRKSSSKHAKASAEKTQFLNPNQKHASKQLCRRAPWNWCKLRSTMLSGRPPGGGKLAPMRVETSLHSS